MSAPINSAKAAALLAEVAPAVVRVELYPQWSDGAGPVVRRQRVTLYDAAGRIVGDLEAAALACHAVMGAFPAADWDRPQTFTVDGATLALTYPVVMTLPEALLSPAVDAYRTAQLDGQRHELEDPAEPPLAVRAVVEPDPVRDCARSLADGHMSPVDWGPAPTPAAAAVDVETGGAL